MRLFVAQTTMVTVGARIRHVMAGPARSGQLNRLSRIIGHHHNIQGRDLATIISAATLVARPQFGVSPSLVGDGHIAIRLHQRPRQILPPRHRQRPHACSARSTSNHARPIFQMTVGAGKRPMEKDGRAPLGTVVPREKRSRNSRSGLILMLW